MRRLAVCVALAAWCGLALAQPRSPHEELTLEIYRELVETNTVHPDGDNTAAARAMARRLTDAGFDAKDVLVYEPAPRKGNLVARYRAHQRLSGREAADHFLAERLLLHLGDELLHHRQACIGVEQREPHLAQHLLHVVFGKPRVSAQRFDDGG